MDSQTYISDWFIPMDFGYDIPDEEPDGEDNFNFDWKWYEKVYLFNPVPDNRNCCREQGIQSLTRMAGRNNNISHNDFLYLQAI